MKIDKIFNSMPLAYAYHRMIYDEQGEPVDYEFIEVNETFEKYLSLKSSEIIGKKISEIMPNILEEKAGWVKKYGEVVKYKKTIDFDEYAEALDKWFHVFVFSPEDEYFCTFFF